MSMVVPPLQATQQQDQTAVQDHLTDTQLQPLTRDEMAVVGQAVWAFADTRRGRQVVEQLQVSPESDVPPAQVMVQQVLRSTAFQSYMDRHHPTLGKRVMHQLKSPQFWASCIPVVNLGYYAWKAKKEHGKQKVAKQMMGGSDLLNDMMKTASAHHLSKQNQAITQLGIGVATTALSASGIMVGPLAAQGAGLAMNSLGGLALSGGVNTGVNVTGTKALTYATGRATTQFAGQGTEQFEGGDASDYKANRALLQWLGAAPRTTPEALDAAGTNAQEEAYRLGLKEELGFSLGTDLRGRERNPAPRGKGDFLTAAERTWYDRLKHGEATLDDVPKEHRLAMAWKMEGLFEQQHHDEKKALRQMQGELPDAPEHEVRTLEQLRYAFKEWIRFELDGFFGRKLGLLPPQPEYRPGWRQRRRDKKTLAQLESLPEPNTTRPGQDDIDRLTALPQAPDTEVPRPDLEQLKADLEALAVDPDVEPDPELMADLPPPPELRPGVTLEMLWDEFLALRVQLLGTPTPPKEFGQEVADVTAAINLDRKLPMPPTHEPGSLLAEQLQQDLPEPPSSKVKPPPTVDPLTRQLQQQQRTALGHNALLAEVPDFPDRLQAIKRQKAQQQDVKGLQSRLKALQDGVDNDVESGMDQTQALEARLRKLQTDLV